MKILYVVTQGEQGGAQKYISDLAPEMLKKGYEIFVAVGEIENEGDKWLFLQLEKSGIKKENLFEIKSHQREIKLFRDIKSVWDFFKLYKKINPDVVHLNSSKSGVVGAVASFLSSTLPGSVQLKSKCIFTVHGFVFLEPMNILKKLFFIFLEIISSVFRTHTILITEKDVSVGKKYFILRNKNKYSLIQNGVKYLQVKMLEKKEARKYIFEKINKKDEEQKVVGTISNLYKTKGLEYLIEAAAKILQKFPETIFLVLGFGEDKYREELQEKINKLKMKDNFFLLGKTPDAYKYLKAFDVFTLTSLKEGLPYTLLEAKMAGVPIVATSVGGIPEMAEQFEINLVQSKNVEEISGVINKLLLDNSLPRNTDLPEIYKLETMCKKTEEVYLKL